VVKSKQRIKRGIKRGINRSNKEIIFVLFLLFALPISIFGVYQIHQFFGRAALPTSEITSDYQNQNYNPVRSAVLPSATPTPAICCEIWAKNLCDGSGFGSYDVLVQQFSTEEECNNYHTPTTYSCNCDEHCTTGNNHDSNQVCTTGKSDNITFGKSKCSTNDFRVQIVNPTVCAAANASSCLCEKMDVSGVIAKGQTIRLDTYAKVEDPDHNAKKVLNMVYHVEKNGKETDKPTTVAAIGPERTTDQAGKPIDRYYTTWNYTVPDTSGATEYKIRAEINCGPKTTSLVTSSREEGGFLSPIIRFFNNLFKIQGILPIGTSGAPTPFPTMIVRAPIGARTLQLGTFIPSTVTLFEKDCTWVRFKVK